MTQAEVEAEVAKVKFWRHTIEVRHGVFTPGQEFPATIPPQKRIAQKLDMGFLPADLHGKSVLDIGAWDGFYSFEAEKRGAARVLATDHYVWNHPGFGMEGFLTAHRLLESRVEYKDVDVLDIAPDTVGTFDVVLFLGVLYHLVDPLGALQRVALVTRELCIVETMCANVRGGNSMSLMRLLPDSIWREDPTNWWAPNVRCVEQMLLQCGFSDVKIVRAPKVRSYPRLWRMRPFPRATFYAHKRT